MRFDFHLHSYYSDGLLSPAELTQKCQEAKLDIIALTDHENTNGFREALEAGNKFGIKVIPGIEFSVDYEEKEQHLLGLFIDHASPELKEFTRKGAESKRRQIAAIIEKLQKIGFAIEFEEVLKRVKGSLNRSHIGYAVLEKKENSEILAHFGVNNMSDFFEIFLKKKAYVERKRPSVKEVIELIKRLKGRAIWAHPCWKQDIEEIRQMAPIFQKFGLDGLEVCYNTKFMDKERALALHAIAMKFSLLETGGSDFHSFSMDKFNKLADFETFGLDLNLPPEVFEMLGRQNEL